MMRIPCLSVVLSLAASGFAQQPQAQPAPHSPHAPSHAVPSADDVWNRLMAGNARFVAGKPQARATGAVYSSQPVLTPPDAQTVYQPATYQAPSYQPEQTYPSQPTYQPQASYQSPAPAPAPAAQPEAQPASYSTQSSSGPAPAPAPTPAPLSADQLNSLVAPIALYPDALVAQVLAASTNPDQVAYAQHSCCVYED